MPAAALREVLMFAYDNGGFTTRSDFARTSAEAVAAAASQALISSIRSDGRYGNVWRLTTKGLTQIMGPIPDEPPPPVAPRPVDYFPDPGERPDLLSADEFHYAH
jgi:hypothetical protein